MNLEEHCNDLYFSYEKLTQKILLEIDATKSLDFLMNEFKYPIASHSLGDVPLFNYANEAMLNLFKIPRDEFIGLASYQSANEINRKERESLLAQVRKTGFVENYQGFRVKKNGDTFLIKKATVWNVSNNDGQVHSQAVIIFDWQDY